MTFSYDLGMDFFLNICSLAFKNSLDALSSSFMQIRNQNEYHRKFSGGSGDFYLLLAAFIVINLLFKDFYIVHRFNTAIRKCEKKLVASATG